jgi:hypothetical protein
MNLLKHAMYSTLLIVLSSLVKAHEGHGIPGSVGHDLQHQVWTFAGLVAVAALLMAGDSIAVLLRARVTRSKREERKEK